MHANTLTSCHLQSLKIFLKNNNKMIMITKRFCYLGTLLNVLNVLLFKFILSLLNMKSNYIQIFILKKKNYLCVQLVNLTGVYIF